MNGEFDCQTGQLYLEDTIHTYAQSASVPIDEIQWLPAADDAATYGCVIWSAGQQVYWPIAAQTLADPQSCVELAYQAEVVVRELRRGQS